MLKLQSYSVFCILINKEEFTKKHLFVYPLAQLHGNNYLNNLVM